MNAGDGAVTAVRTRADGNTRNKLTREKRIFRALQRDAFGLLLMLLYTNACYNLGLATTKPPPRHAAQSAPHRFAAARAACAERVMARTDQTEPGQVVIKHAIALPLC